MKNAKEKSTQNLMKKPSKAPLVKSGSATAKDLHQFKMSVDDEEAMLPEEILAAENETDETLSRTPEAFINLTTGGMNQNDEDEELEDEGPEEDEDDVDEDLEEDDEDVDFDEDEDEEFNDDTDEDVEDDYEGIPTKSKRKY